MITSDSDNIREERAMAGKVTIRVTKGCSEGKSYSYTEKESLVLGRKKVCTISFLEKTVSRFHCLLDIAPPSVMVRDFGSKNGTWLNGKMIGQRPDGMSPEEAQRQRFNEYAIHDGDALLLGPDCELTFQIEVFPVCVDCGAALDKNAMAQEGGILLCEACLEKRRAFEKKRAEAEALVRAAAENAERQDSRIVVDGEYAVRRCAVCGAALPAGAREGDLCGNCKRDPFRVIEGLLERAENGDPDAAMLKGFEVIELLGEGGMAQVWLVEEVATGRQLALKVMLPRAYGDCGRRELFLREASLLGQLNHANIVRHVATGGFGDSFYILMEYCSGGSMEKVMHRAGGRLELEEATDVLCQVLDGLSYAHTAAVSLTNRGGETVSLHGVVHRDLKPANIFVQKDRGRTVYKVADFGLAKAFESSGMTGHTMTGQYCGTFWYMPRCQILNCRYSTPAVDIWAALASYYELLTGRPAREFSLWEDYACTVLNRPPVPIRERNEHIPRALAHEIDSFLYTYDETCDCPITAAEMKKRIQEAL